MEIASGLLSSACQLACGPICQQLNYIRKLRENEEIMQSEWETLRSVKNDICENLNICMMRYGKRPKESVTNWLEKVEKIEKSVNSLGSCRANHICCKGFCPNYYSRLKRSKKAVEIHSEVKGLQEKGMPFAQRENLFIDSLPETSSSLPATALHGTSAERKKEDILQCIRNPMVSKIGVYGMGGVGKTKIMTEIYNELNKKEASEIVIWVTVSSSLNEQWIQNKIAERLGCQLSLSADLKSRAQELHEAFVRSRKNFIIILDDIWRKVSLENVGIPEPNRSNGSKIVWTTRNLVVCNDMESEKEIKVEGLTDEEEAWSLFKDKVGAEDVMSVEIQPIAKQVARECGGLPLALITVGRALRKAYQPSVWRNALQQLKTSRGDQIHGMGEEVFGSLKFSYNWLSSDTTRACFLYCALYPEDADISVDELIEYWMAERLIGEEASLQTEKDKGHAYLKELTDACMIETTKDDRYVRMHDLIRDLAINITREQFIVKAGLQLKEPPKEEEWIESLERASMINHEIEVFLGQPNCPRLSTLLLHKYTWPNKNKVTFLDTFFKHMHKLRVLDLSNTGIVSLPNSLSDLVNLCALILNGCDKLQCLPSLAKLHKLRQLKLQRLISLKELPHGLENLVKLRHLDISYGYGVWESFPTGALLKMSSLEILLVGSSGWALADVSNGDAEDDSTFGEIIRLKKLRRFSADFANVLTFNSFIRKADESGLFDKLGFFLFQVHHKYDAHNVESMEEVKLPATSNYLAIKGCNFIQLSDIFGSDSLRPLIMCTIQSCNEMEWIAKGGENVFSSVETLHLFDLKSFKGLWKEKPHEEALKNLRCLHISGCHKLKYMMPIDLLVNNLQNLEEISIFNCNEMEDIISGNASASMASLMKLKKLTLHELPALTSIYQQTLFCDSLCYIQIKGCPNLKKLPFLMKSEPPVGMRILVSEEWWETLEWEEPQLKELLQPFIEGFDRRGWDIGRVAFGKEMIKIGQLPSLWGHLQFERFISLEW